MRRLAIAFSLCLAAALPLHAAITGTLVNSDGQPVAGAKVSIFAQELPGAQFARITSATPDRTALASATSDTKGKFSIESPKDAVVTLSVSAAGYAPVAMAERDEEHGAILLTSATMKSGRVTAAGKPVAGAKVIVTGNGGEFIATTDAEGRYSIPDPERWATHLSIVHPDYALVDEMKGGIEARKFASDRTLDAGVALRGRVVAADGKTPAGGATIAINGRAQGKPADDGTFMIAHATRKWTTIAASTKGLAGERAHDNTAIAIRTAPTATVSGTIRDAKTRAPLAGVEVHLSEARRFMPATYPASAITDTNGAFSMSVPAGTYQLLMSRPGYVFANTTLTATPNAKVTKSLVATQLARVTGTVVDENKGAVAGTRLEAGSVARESGFRMFRNRDVDTSAISGPDGAFAMRIEPDTDVQIEAKKKGYPEARSSTLHFAPGERKAGVVLTIPLGVSVTGQVVDKNGKGISGAAITANESRSGGGPGQRFFRRMRLGGRGEDDNAVRTAADGSFTMHLKPGTYDFRVSREGYATKTINSRQVAASAQPLAVMLEPGVQLDGRVTRGGVGVEGVNIDLFGNSVEGHAETAADGSFHIADLTPGQVMVSVQKQEDFIQQFKPVTIPTDQLVIDLPTGGTVSGRVVEKDSGSPVTAFDAGFANMRGGGGMVFQGPPLTKHFTSDDGTFVLNNVPPGVTMLTVTAPGYTTGRVQNVKVENGKTLPDVEVQMEHGVRVTGRVTGPDGNAISGASVAAQGGGAARRSPAAMFNGTTTDANGEYEIDNLDPGDHTFMFEAAGYITTEKAATLSGTDTRVDAQLTSGMRLTGVVVNDAGAPIPDADVQAQTAAGSGFHSTQTDAGGGFVLEGLIPGRYTFHASKTGYASGTLSDFDISSGAPVRIVVQSGGTITGHITGLSADELTRASVSAQSATGSFSAGTVDPGGSYRIEGAPTGTVRVRASVSGTTGFSGRSSPVQSVQVDPGGSAQADIAFPTGVVQGRVTRDGVAATNAMVVFTPQRGAVATNARVMTDGNGNYQAVGLEDATYDVQVADLNSTPYATSYTVSGGSGTFNIDIRSSTLRGRVTDATTNEPIADAVLMLRPSGDAGPRMPLRVAPSVTDASGTFTMDSVPPGTYNINAEKDGYGTKSVDVTVGDSPASVDIQLAPNAGLALRIIDARNGQSLSAYLRVMNASNAVVYESPFRFASGGPDTMKLPLDAGTYRVLVVAQGYAAQTVTVSAPSTQTVAMTPGGSIAIKSNGAAMRRARLLGPDGTEYMRNAGPSLFSIDPSPGTTILQNIAPGTYTLQILDSNGAPTASTQVTVTEGQVAQASI